MAWHFGDASSWGTETMLELLTKFKHLSNASDTLYAMSGPGSSWTAGKHRRLVNGSLAIEQP